MRPLLLILNPRAIPECMEAFDRLTVPRAYLTGYTERQLERVISDLIKRTDFTHYVAVSDDVIVTQDAVDQVYDQLALSSAAGRFTGIAHDLGLHVDSGVYDEVITGWCNLDDLDHRCSVVDRPLTGETPTAESYSFVHWADVAFHPEPLIRTWFAGMCLTGMSREMWQRYPFRVMGPPDSPGWASDFSLCTRLQADSVPILAVRDAGVRHVRAQWDVPDREPRKRLLVGMVTPHVRIVE